MTLMQTPPKVLDRQDTFFGVCQALGDDFGFNPIILRLALGMGLIWNPVVAVAAYAGPGWSSGSRGCSPRTPAPWRAEAVKAEAGRAAPASDNDSVADTLAAAA